MSTSVSARPGEDNSFPSPRPPPNRPNNSGLMEVSQSRSAESLVERTRPLPTSLQSDFIPEDILMALTKAQVPREQLGPPSRYKTMLPAKSKPSNVWNFKRKDRFKHLAENTPCICGSGKDISFLYDVPTSKKKSDKDSSSDPSSVRKDQEEKKKSVLKLPDTLLPDEYHIVKNKGVMGIEYHEDKYTTQADDHEQHLVVFPSLNPAGRYEVVQLKQTMEDMLDKSGVNDEDVEIKGPTQMHNLLELIKKEQNIYNLIFHEVIRQVSVECIDRGELLAELRNKYSSLLNKVPQQIKSLHEEVLAQRALDRRLTEELMRFKATITILTNELSEVKEHDKRVTREAQDAQEDLRTALIEAQKNASLLGEYHELYELQRHRLEKQVKHLTEEKEIWSTASYCLALKVTQESKLTTAKNLHVSEKAWSKLANHFTILLSDKDTEMLTQIQSYVDKWRDLIEDFNFNLKRREEDMKSQLKIVNSGLSQWNQEYQKHCFSKEGHFQSPPTATKINQLLEDVRGWEQVLTQVTESLTGETFLSSEEELIFIRKHVESWTDSAIKCFGRHRAVDGTNHPELEAMISLNQEVDDLINQYFVRLTGENGTAQGIIHLLNVFETWSSKLMSHVNGSAAINDSEWSRFSLLLDDWLSEVSITIDSVGATQKPDDRSEGKFHIRRDIHDIMRKCQKWVSTATNSVDSEDAKLVEQVGALHSEMIKWMVQILLRLAPNREDNSEEAADMALVGSVPISELHTTAKSLFGHLTTFSKYVTLCCDGIVLDNTQMRRDNREDDAEHEYRDLQRLRTECSDWIRTAKILMCQLTGEPIEILFPPEANQSQDNKGKTVPNEKPVYTYSDQEKLQTSRPNKEVKTGKTDVPTGEAQVDQETKEDMSPMTATSSLETAQTTENTQTNQSEQASSSTQSPSNAQNALSAQATSSAQTVGSAENIEDDERIEMIGFDSNTHIHDLTQVTGQAMPGVSPTQEKPSTPTTPQTQKAFEALAALKTLQTQLVDCEERCQFAEERATSAEGDLAVSLEKQRALEKRVSQLEEAMSKNKQLLEATDKAGSSSTSPTPTERRLSKESVSSDGKAEAKTKRADSRSSLKYKGGRKKSSA